MKAQIQAVGEVDDAADVWALFQADAQGRFGLYEGELVTELQEKLPALRGQIAEVLRRGLQSEDPAERRAAIAGAYQFRGKLDIGTELERISTRFPDEALWWRFLDVLSWQGPSAEARRALASAETRQIPAESRDSYLRAVAAITPERVAGILVDALGSRRDDFTQSLLAVLSRNQLDSAAKALLGLGREERARFVMLAFSPLRADQSPGAYEQWLQFARELDAVPEALPTKPVETEGMRSFAERLPGLLAADEQAVGAVAEAPTTVVLLPEVWVDGLRSPEGPPADLFARLRSREVTLLVSDGLLNEIAVRLLDQGYELGQVDEALARVRTVAKLCPEPTVSELAKAAGIDRIYGVGPMVGMISDGVAIRPVHELLALLR